MVSQVTQERSVSVILFVDDNKQVRQFCKYELGRAGYSVILAEDGDKALRVLRRERPALVVMDLHMPRLNGLETAKLIRAQRPDLPIVFFTSHTGYLNDERTRLGEAWVEKSEDLTELKARMAQLLAPSQGMEDVVSGLQTGAADPDER